MLCVPCRTGGSIDAWLEMVVSIDGWMDIWTLCDIDHVMSAMSRHPLPSHVVIGVVVP